MKVKICGITNLEDAEIAIKAGADALGFVFYQKSPRYISPENCKKIISQLPPFIEKVGLFVNESSENIEKYFKISGVSLAQIHFEIKDNEVEKLEIPYIRVIRARNEIDLDKYSDEYRFVDAFVDEFGGSGKRLNLKWFENRDNSKTILAGGLTPDNLSEIQGFGFYGVDVSSGVEEKKGQKSKEKVISFLKIGKNIF